MNSDPIVVTIDPVSTVETLLLPTILSYNVLPGIFVWSAVTPSTETLSRLNHPCLVSSVDSVHSLLCIESLSCHLVCFSNCIFLLCCILLCSILYDDIFLCTAGIRLDFQSLFFLPLISTISDPSPVMQFFSTIHLTWN